jgi:hypothetical protein
MKGSVVEHHLIPRNEPQKDIRIVTEVVVFSGASLDPSTGSIELPLKEHEKASILRVSVLWSQNDYPDGVCLRLGPLFEVPIDAPRLKGHPDETGLTYLPIPGEWKGPLNSDARVLYQPNFLNLGANLLTYIGMEKSIMHPRSVAVASKSSSPLDDFEIFKPGDPFVSFILDNAATCFSEHIKPDDILRVNSSQNYAVRKSATQRVRQFFENAVFPQFRYNTTGTISIQWDRQPVLPLHGKFVIAIVQVEYVVIKPTVLTMFKKMAGIKLDI